MFEADAAQPSGQFGFLISCLKEFQWLHLCCGVLPPSVDWRVRGPPSPAGQSGMMVTTVLWQHLLLPVVLLKEEASLSNGEMMSAGSLMVRRLKKMPFSPGKTGPCATMWTRIWPPEPCWSHDYQSLLAVSFLLHCSDPSPAWFICPLELIPDVLSPVGLDVAVGSGVTSTIAKRVWNNRLLHLKPVLLCQLFTLWIVGVNLCCPACWTQLRTRTSVGSCIETWSACGTDADSVSTGCCGTGGGVNDA